MLETSSNIQQPPVVSWKLSVFIYIDDDKSPAGAESVTDADLCEARSQVWFDGCICNGHIDVGMDDLKYQLMPIIIEGTRFCPGFLIRSTDPAGKQIQTEFGIDFLGPVASRGADILREAGLLEERHTYRYRVVATRLSADEAAPGRTRRMRLTEKARPLTFLEMPIAPLLASVSAVDIGLSDHAYPVFYSTPALAKAQRISRKGAACDPGVETGALLAGPLCICPKTRRVFAIVTHVFEFADSERTPYSLAPSGETWRRIQSEIQEMQAVPATRHHRALGSCHGHNFPVPEGRKSSVFISQDDRLWSAAVFSRQPYQLCHIFGADGAGNEDQRLYGMEQGRLRQRGYYVIPPLAPVVRTQS
ncbi:MAG: hypothetical protein ACHRHE_22695 [Tepidisphaerales bacterium]